jgi:hypothetical protein
VASFLGRHGEKQGVLPSFGVIKAAHARELSVNARSTVMPLFRLCIHRVTMPRSRRSDKALHT